ARLEIRGPQINENERRHREQLEARVRFSDALRGRASIEDAVTREEVPDLMRAADLVVNPTRGMTAGGALDKVVFESAACAVPVLACNPNLAGLLPSELLFRPEDPADLARALLAFAATSPDERAETGRELRRRVEESHSVDTWAAGVVAAIRQL